MNSSIRILLVFSLLTLSLSFISTANAARGNSQSSSGNNTGQNQETIRLGGRSEARMGAQQKVTKAQIDVAEYEKKVADLHRQLSAINNCIPQLQARMTEWNIAALSLPSPTSVSSTQTVAAVTPEPEQTGDILSNMMDFLKKYWLYGLGGLLVVLWLVSRSMK